MATKNDFGDTSAMKNPEKESDSEVHRVGGQLHFLHHVTDDKGNRISTVTGPLKVEFRLEDLGQLVAGACAMALPVALTEEVWNLGETLSIGRTLIILGFSVLALAGFIWGIFYGSRIMEYRGHFFKRAVSSYVVTFLVALLLLILFDKAPLDDLRVTFTRTILVAFPASFAATAVDYIK
jgi:uncharacterized membrane protein